MLKNIAAQIVTAMPINIAPRSIQPVDSDLVLVSRSDLVDIVDQVLLRRGKKEDRLAEEQARLLKEAAARHADPAKAHQHQQEGEAFRASNAKAAAQAKKDGDVAKDEMARGTHGKQHGHE